jgi:hypothetical protein
MSGRNSSIAGRMKRLAVGVIACASPVALYAQSCAMCYQSVAASGARSIHALQSGILILIFPPAFICVGITIVAYRRRNLYNE